MYTISTFEINGERCRITSFNVIPEAPANIRISKEVYDFIKQNILKGKLTYSKHIPFPDLSISDITVEECNMFDEVKYKAVKYFRWKYLEKSLNKDTILVMTEYMMITTELASRGFFITESNKEEMYAKIINAGSEDLLLMLEEYSYLLDYMKGYSTSFKDYLRLRRELQECTTVEEIIEVVRSITGIDFRELAFTNV